MATLASAQLAPGPASGSVAARPDNGRDPLLRGAAVAGAALTVALGVAVLYLVAHVATGDAVDDGSRTATGLFVTGMAGLALAGAAVLRQQPRATIGWLLLAAALAGTASRFSIGLAVDADQAGAGWTPAAGWVTNWSWVPGQALALVLFLRFPDGRLPGRRWRWAERAVLAWAILTVAATATLPGELGVQPLADHDNPLGVAALEGLLEPALGVLFTAAPVLAAVAVAAPVSRWRAAGPEERRQLRLVGLALLLVAGTAPLALVSRTGILLEGIAYIALPAAIGWAVLRHRLWDLELRRRFDRLRLVREEERARLQRELHDTLGPLLGSIGMRAEAARNLLAQGDGGRVAEVLGGIDADTQAAVVEVRRIIDELVPSVLADADLATAVRALVREYDDAGPLFAVEVPEELPPLAAAHELVAYRVAAEAVRNVVRHAAARHCRVSITVDGTTLRVVVADDGAGLGGHPAGVGRRGMADRVAQVGGSLTVTEPESGGVVVRAELPGAVR